MCLQVRIIYGLIPGRSGSKYTICVMPEWNNSSVDGFAGVCSDYIGDYKC